jgi:hypothetical protein
MKRKVKIAKICLNVDGKHIELTLAQAQELKNVLNETFGEKVTEYIYPYMPSPTVIYPPGVRAYPGVPQQPQIWCGSSTGDGVMMNSANCSGSIENGAMSLTL